MERRTRTLVGVIVLFCLLTVTPAFAQQVDDFRFFDETRHNVQGAFWQYYNSLSNPRATLGYPITEQFTNKENKLVQYFQRARLEVTNGEVKLTPLGTLNYQPGLQLNIDNSMACRSFSTGHSVCFAFLEFFDANGGLDFFGYPISPFEFQDDVIVQYFQNGRMEWRPSNPDGQRVVMTDLGTSYFYTAGEDVGLLNAAQPLHLTTKTEVLLLNVRAFPWKAVTFATDSQMVFVVVQDQTLQAVRGATGTAKVTWTDGSVQTLDILTGDSGISTLILPVTDQAYGGLVTIEVSVTHGNLSGHTTTSFRIWY